LFGATPPSESIFRASAPFNNEMKKLALTVIALATLVFTQARAEELTWQTDLPKAQAQAKAEKKLVLINFTGSDWCPWCWKLRDEIFKTPEFATYAKQNLVLVEADFPRKTKLPADQAKANNALKDKYEIKGFPTVVVLNGAGTKVGQLGYMKDGPAAFTKELDAIKAGKPLKAAK
jgi:thioredoxin-related protein